jgi:hypothetical protein
MYAERGFCSLLFIRIAFCGPIDCGSAVRGRIGWISWQVTFRELFVIALTYYCLCLGDRRGRFGSSYRCSSFGGRCTYIHHLFQRMLLSCGVWSAYGPLIACASWIERLYVWGEVFFAYRVLFLFLSGILARLSGWQQVRVALYACIHRSSSGRCLVQTIASMVSKPDLTCAVRGGWVPWIPSAQAAVFRSTIAAPRHRTLRYPTLTGPPVPCLPAPAPCLSSSVCP